MLSHCSCSSLPTHSCQRGARRLGVAAVCVFLRLWSLSPANTQCGGTARAPRLLFAGVQRPSDNVGRRVMLRRRCIEPCGASIEFSSKVVSHSMCHEHEARERAMPRASMVIAAPLLILCFYSQARQFCPSPHFLFLFTGTGGQ